MTLPTQGLPIFSWVGTAHQHAVFGIDQDALITPVSAELVDDAVALTGQASSHISIKSRFQSQAFVGVTEAWGFSGVLRIHSKIDDVRDDLNMSLGLHVASHNTEREERLAVLEDHRRYKRMEGTFPWSQAVAVRRVQRIRPAPVVEHDTRAIRYDS